MHKVLNDFKLERKVSTKLINQYQGKIPNQVIEIWEHFGFGSCMDGFLKIINPNDFQDILNRIYSIEQKINSFICNCFW